MSKSLAEPRFLLEKKREEEQLLQEILPEETTLRPYLPLLPFPARIWIHYQCLGGFAKPKPVQEEIPVPVPDLASKNIAEPLDTAQQQEKPMCVLGQDSMQIAVHNHRTHANRLHEHDVYQHMT